MATRSFLLLATVVILQATSSAAQTVSLNPGSQASLIEARARFTGSNSDTVYDRGTPTSVPESGTQIATDGRSLMTSSSVDYDFTNTGLTTAFDFVLQEYGSGYAGFYEETYFSLSNDVAFELSGFFTSAHSEPGRTSLDIELRNLTTNTLIFHNQQRSLDTQNQSFVVGGSAADWINVVEGVSMGFLHAGHEYSLIQWAFVNNAPFGTTSATASGEFQLAFNPVPEPSSALLIVLGLGVLARERPSR